MPPLSARGVRALCIGLRFALPLGVLALTAGGAAAQSAAALENAFPALSFTDPTELTYAEDGSNRLYVAEKDGIIRVFENNRDVAASSVYLNIAGIVQNSGERGLLGLAFHPQYADSGYVYVHYSANNGDMVVSRFSRSATDSLAADPATERVLIRISDFASNHNGGKIAFGPSEGPDRARYLYISFGDGGGGGDPMNYGQNRTVLFGKLLRIDVDHPEAPLNYGIPPDNPYAGGTAGFREEIFAYGLRNMWKFSFDRADGTIWGADVGQGQWEEIDLIHSGDNLGWRIMEGAHCFNPSSGCNQTGLELPIYEYDHSSSRCSITGGFVYRGVRNPELTGEYIYGDYCGGQVYGLTYDGTTATNRFLVGTGFGLIAFGEDQAGEVYVLRSGGPNTSRVLRFVPTAGTAGEPSAPGAAGVVLRLLGSNPAAGAVRLVFSAPQAARARVAVYDVLGREVARLFDGALAANVLRDVVLDGARLAPGTYVVRLTTDRGAGAQRTVTIAR